MTGPMERVECVIPSCAGCETGRHAESGWTTATPGLAVYEEAAEDCWHSDPGTWTVHSQVNNAPVADGFADPEAAMAYAERCARYSDWSRPSRCSWFPPVVADAIDDGEIPW